MRGIYHTLQLYLRGMLDTLLLYHAARGVAEPEVRHRLLLTQVPAAAVDDLMNGREAKVRIRKGSQRERGRGGEGSQHNQIIGTEPIQT